MGGQACVFYGAAQFSKDVDPALLASEENFSGCGPHWASSTPNASLCHDSIRTCWRAVTRSISGARAAT